jgi:siroheme synthase
MGVHTARFLEDVLLKKGRSPDTPVLVVENASLVNQRNRRLRLKGFSKILTDDPPNGPTILIIGTVVKGDAS